MKILDRYIAKNFLIGYVIAFCVLVGLRIIIDLFVNLDEFTENADLGSLAVIKNISTFYLLNSTLYFRDFAGMITVVAAAFSLGKIIRNRELVAVMASGVSLKRVIAPIVLLSLLLTALLVIDQEFVIPALSDRLVRNHDDVPGEESYDVWFIEDEKGSLICSRRFDVKQATLHQPTIILRSNETDSVIWEMTGQISAEQAVYNYKDARWDLVGGSFVPKGFSQEPRTVTYYKSDITPRDIPVMCKAENKSLLSLAQLSALSSRKTKVRDIAQLHSQKHFHITEPVINFAMLLLTLPVLVCRDPSQMKSAVMLSFCLTGSCFITVFICRMFAAEVVFGRLMPELWAWLPIFIFLPLAFFKLDSMKT